MEFHDKERKCISVKLGNNEKSIDQNWNLTKAVQRMDQN